MLDLDKNSWGHCRRDACPSELELEQYGLGELEPIARVAVENAVKECSGCAERLALLSKGFEQFTQFDAEQMLSQISKATEGAVFPRQIAQALNETAPKNGQESVLSRILSWLTKPFLVPVMVGAAALIVYVTRAPEAPHGASPQAIDQADLGGVRIKGQAIFEVYRARAGQIDTPSTGSSFKAGDRIRFSIKTQNKSFVMILGREASQTVYTAFPMDSEQAQPVEIGRTDLPGSLELDDSVGKETLAAVICKKPFKRSDVTWHLDKAPVIADCQVALFVMDKGE
ncbi:MAG: hypothetical protein ACON3Z_04935 [Bradymonadia bacterium]